MKPSAKRKQILAAIQAGHDWIDGQVFSGGGTRYSSRDTCQLCGLIRQWHKDEQNGNPGTYSFLDHHGDDLPLLDVPTTCCKGEP